MEAADIKRQCSPFPWAINGVKYNTSGHGSSNADIGINDTGGMANGTVDQQIMLVSDLWDNPKRDSNAAAIVTAVNNTYGKGYDPECMEEMYRELQNIVDCNEAPTPLRLSARELLFKVKIK